MASNFRQCAGLASEHIIHDQTAGELSYDPDGHGPLVQVQFVQLAAGTPLTYWDLFHL